jgi:hypothetical protein
LKWPNNRRETARRRGGSVVTHIVIFSWIDAVTAAQVETFRQAFEEMAAALKEFATFSHGPDLRFREGNGDYAVAAIFPDRTCWDAYQAHPLHKAFIRDFVTPIQASRLTIQF